MKYPDRIFSGIQPTGSLHIGNYLGAIQKWVELQNDGNDTTYCIVDNHSITLPQDPKALRQYSLLMTATLLACGIDPMKSTLFLQSDVTQHTELGWILGCLTTLPRLSHFPQFKEKSSKLKDVPLGLFVYPVLQAADIMLYKSTHVPVGEDQVQHLQLSQHLAKIFNTKFGETFPICNPIIADDSSCRIKSLRDPSKKMSKSDPDPKATIFVTDTSDVIREKMKKAITDFTSEVTFDVDNRPGVSNLITIHSLMACKSIEDIIVESQGINTGQYKLVAAESVVEFINPIRTKINEYLLNEDYLWDVLKEGSDKARNIAEHTIAEVKDKVGLGRSTTRLNNVRNVRI